MNRPVIYIFLNKKLNMTVGKAAAQAAHAAAMAVVNSPQESVNKWEDAVHRTMIVLEARDNEHLQNISEYLGQRHLHVLKIVDEGANEVEPHSWTALATQILDKENEHVEQTFRTFKLYRDAIRVVLEMEK